MELPSKPPKFLTFHGKRYDPSIEWNDKEGLLQAHLSMLHTLPPRTTR